MKIAAATLAASFALATTAYAGGGDPEPPPDPDPPEPTYSFNGIAALGGCSGSVFRLDGQPMDDFALVLTNGHCIGLLGEFEVIVEEATNRQVRLFNVEDAEAGTFDATEIVYGTMHQTDMAILRLDVTYDELAASNIDALVMSDGRATEGDELVIVSGLWEYVTQCALDGFVYSMLEDKYTWYDSLRFTQECVTFGGTSGSPVISLATGQIIGVNNTGFEGGEACSINNPCEVDEEGNITTITDGSYGQQTYQLYGCMNDDFELDLGREGCDLPKPKGELGTPGFDVAADEDCDDDGNLDAGDTATVTVTVYNDGAVALTNTEVTVSSPSPNVTIVAGDVTQVAEIPARGSVDVAVTIALAEDVEGMDTVDLVAKAANPDSIETEVSATTTLRVNFDDVPNSSTTDDVESAASPWLVEVDGEAGGWVREVNGAGNTVWHAEDIDENGDQYLVSPVLEAGDGDLVVSLRHRFKFETSGGTFWDGGVVEVSTDDGATWTDASELAGDFGYGGAITTQSGNPLADRQAFVNESPAWPDRSDLEIDFGTALAGESVRLRFRVGTDAAAGDFGWEIDDIAVDGITNQPFATIQDDAGTCGAPEDPEDPEDPMDPEDPTDPDPTPEPDAGCACSTGGAPSGGTAAVFALVALVALRRRRSWR